MNERRYHDWYGGERRQSWATPPAFFAPLHDEYGFTLDGASENGNGLLPRASTADAPISWEGERVFCNPPWSNIRPFVELAATAELAVLLVPARTCARWFHRALDLDATVRYFKPKPKFVGAKHVSPVDCVLLVFGSPEPSPFALLYDAVAAAEKLDTNAGDSAVSIALWSFAQRFEHGASRTGVDSHPLHPPPTQKGGRHTMTSHQVPIGQVTGLFASVEPDQFGQTVDDLFRAARSISNAVVDEVEQQGITTTQGAAVIANVTGCLFGWTEFHREVRPADLALMQLGQVQGQVHGDGQ